MESKPTASVTQDIQVPITSLYGLLMQWNKWIDWWPMYSTMTAFKLVKNPQTGKEERVILAGDQVPSAGDYYREFVTLDDKTYVEYLRAHDPSNPHTLQYDYISVQPGMPFIESITSKIVLQELEPNKTRVTWESWTKVAAGTDPAALAGVVQVQNKVYGKGIKFALQYLVVAAVWRDGFKILQERAMAMTKALLVGQTEPWAYFDLVKDRPFPRFVKGLPVKEALPPKKVGKMLGRFLEVGYLQAAEQIFEKTANLPAGTDLYKIAAEQVVDVYGTKDIQEISEYLFKHASEDAEFCQQLLQGCNPLHIKVVSSVDQVPETMRHLKGQEKSIQELISAKRLFLVDYKELANLERSNVMYFKAPYLLVYKQIIDGKSQLQILAIQLERKPGATIYTPNGSHPLRYRLARLFVAVADNQVHEFRYHLGLSHLGIEPVIIATHNAFPDGNPIKDFLKPHFEETVGINFLATQTLIAPSGAFTNNTFAVGTNQGVELASDAWRDYDFYKFSFPEQLKARGFDEDRTDGLENYHYRDDGFKLWHIIGTYAKDFVEAHYTSDDAVKNDTILQGWAKEMNDKDKAAIPGFKPSICDRKELAHILQIIVWNGSALHSLLNQPQWPYLGYVPNRPNGLYLDMPPEDGNDITLQYIQQALLPKFATAFQIAFSWLLTLPSETNLMNYSERESHKTHYGKKFHENLQHLTKKLKERNEELRKQGKNPYIFLMPENVACSVDI